MRWTNLQGERVHVRPERDDGLAAGADGGNDARPRHGPRVGDADRVELSAHELAGVVLLEGQLGVPVDAPPHAAQPRGVPRRARRAQEVVGEGLRRRGDREVEEEDQ